MTPEWFVQDNGRECGPYSQAELLERARAGQLRAETPIRQEGHLWTAAGQVPFLAVAFSPPAAQAPTSGATEHSSQKREPTATVSPSASAEAGSGVAAGPTKGVSRGSSNFPRSAIACAFCTIVAFIFGIVFLANRGPSSGAAGGKTGHKERTPAANAVFSDTSPSVVRVHALDAKSQMMGQGSGFVVSEDGLVATNLHVIRGASRAEVVFDDGSTYPVEGVAGVDRQSDLAILVTKGSRLPALALAPDDLPPVGTKVYAIGTPEGLTNTLSEGLVSGHRRINDTLTLIQTSAAISHGSSGGPLLTEEGTVLGITSGFFPDGQNLNFAIPVRRIRRLIAEPRAWTLAQAGAESRAPQKSPTAPSNVRDQARCFGTAAIQEANERIDELTRRFGKTLLVETFTQVPAEDAKRFNAMSKEGQDLYFVEWSRRRNAAVNVRGIYLFVCREPNQVPRSWRLYVSEDTRRMLEYPGKRLAELISADFRRQEFDTVLLAAVAFFEKNLADQRIRDEANWFSPRALSAAKARIESLKRDSGIDLLIETFANVPPDLANQAKAMTSDERTDFFRDWARRRAIVENPGVYILCCHEPKYVQLFFNPVTGPLVDMPMRKMLLDPIRSKLGAQHYDDGLLTAMAFIEQNLADKHVRDEAKCFEPVAIQEANKRISELTRRFGKTFLIETFSDLPAGDLARTKAMTTKERTRYCQERFRQRFGGTKVRGIYVAVCREPGRAPAWIYVYAGHLDNLSEQLYDLMTAEFSRQQFDAGLLAAVKLVEQDLGRAAGLAR